MTIAVVAAMADIIFPCPGCGSDKGAHVHIIKRPKKKKKKSYASFRTVKITKSWADSAEDTEEKRPVQRRYHPYKYLSVIGPFSKRNPVINPPTPKVKEVTEGLRNFAEYNAYWWMMHMIPFEIAPLYFQKYPEEWEQMKEDFCKHVLPASQFIRKITESAIDNRWDRSLIEWAEIVYTALTEGYRTASRKHYALTSDGKKKIYLSTKRIKQIKSMIEQQHILDFLEHEPYYNACITYMFNGAKADPELYEELKRLEQKYNHMLRDDLIKSWENNNNQNQNQSSNQNQNKNQENQYHYTYFEFRHRDEICCPSSRLVF
jgi:hypothetical protein